MSSFEKERLAASELAFEAGKIIARIYAADFAVDFKGKNDPVTEADRLANEFIVTELRKRFPQDRIIAEESVNDAAALQSSGVRRIWYVDPLDGTKEFIAKNGEFSIMIGLSVDGAAQVGAVYRVVGDLLYSGIADVGASVRSQGVERKLRIQSASAALRPEDLRMIGSRSHSNPLLEKMRERIGISKIVPSGSVGIKCAIIAENAADLYLDTSGKSSRWDACAPEAVLRGAGGCFTDLAGRPFRYGTPEMKNTHGIAASSDARTHAFVLSKIEALAREANLI